MTEGIMDRRITKLEGDMVDLGKCVVRLETLQARTIKDYEGLEGKQDEILDELTSLHKTMNGKSKEPVTFKWILEKIALPILLGGGSVAVTVYAVLRTLGG